MRPSFHRFRREEGPVQYGYVAALKCSKDLSDQCLVGLERSRLHLGSRQLTGGRRRPVSPRQHIDAARPHPSIAMFDVEGSSPDRPNILAIALGIVGGTVSQHAEVRRKHCRLGAAEFEAF